MNINNESSMISSSSTPSIMTSSTSSLSYQNEIIESFQIFDEDRSGTISINNLKLILRALGFRVTKHDVLRDVLESHQRRGFQRGHLIKNTYDEDDENDEASIDLIKEINLETVLDVILSPESKYNRKNQNEDEIKSMHKINFRLFDVENKGYISASNLKRVIQELRGYSNSKEMIDRLGGGHHTSSFDDIDDEELRAMIDEFDGDQDGMISEEEFKRIMQHT